MARPGAAVTLVTAVVVDDHPFFRDGVVRGLAQSGRVRVIGEAGDGREGLRMIAAQQPQVAIVDYQMPDIDGLALTHSLTRDGSSTKVLLLSALTESAIVYAAVEAGANGYVSKEATRDEIVQAVVDVAAGRTVIPDTLAAGLVGEIRLRRERTTPVLTDREGEVLRGFARGLSIPQVAAELYLGASTVKTHVQHLYEKLGVSDRAAVAMRHRLVD
ncbi:response regulator [Microbacterium sp.]|uniref:response regulator n=1 Tax=Microbacterium sp. TaxID=51671 RepID=UPI003A958DCF